MAEVSTSPDRRVRCRFGVFEFDAVALELWKSGRAMRIRPQSLRLLSLLLSRPGELATRADLQQGLWDAATFVDYEQGVNHCIKELRAALGDSAESPRYIETLPRRGYRFIAPVEQVVEGAAVAVDVADPPSVAELPPLRNVRRVAAGALFVLAAAGALGFYVTRETTADLGNASEISVLPFAIRPGDAADPLLGIGLARAIAARLGGQQRLQVSSGADGHANSLLLDGEISTSGQNILVVARLKTISGAAVWSEQIRVRADELFSVEDVIAERVTTAVNLRLVAAEQDRLRRRYTDNTAAYQEYLRGLAALVRYTPDSTVQAVASFERALERDPRYALARAGLALACADMYLRFAAAADADRWGVRAEKEARTALELDDDLAEAHLARAAVARKREFDWNATVSSSQRALLLNPNLDQARFFIAAAYYHLGYMQEASIEAQKGRALRGGDLVEPARIEGLVALFSGNFGPALVHLEEVSRLSSQTIGDTYLALASYYSGNVERARTMLMTLARHKSPSTAARSSAALAGVLAAEGQTSAARAQLEGVVASSYRDHHVAYSLGVAYAQLGEMQEAFRWLRTAADTGFPCLPWFERDPLLAPARRVGQFGDLLTYVRQTRDRTLAIRN